VSPSPVTQPSDAPLRASRREASKRFAPYRAAPGSPSRLQAIDGLRALGIAFVLLNHASGTVAFPALLVPVARDAHLGLSGHGVKVFFVISGFLITSILLRELDRSGTIDRLAFLGRRARRLLPTLVAFVSVVAVLQWIGVYRAAPRQIIAALTFSGPNGSWELGHLWSMAVQEQFYLAWTLVLVVGGRRLASHCALLVVIAVPLARVVHATLQPAEPSLYLGSGASFDTLALGCLLALHRDRLATNRWLNAAVESRWALLLLYVLAGASVLVGWRPGVLVRTPLVGAAIVLLLERCIRHPDRGFARILAHPAIVYVGSASYSLYLWQQLFLNPTSTAWPTAFPSNLILAVGVGLLSWHLIERPLSARLSGRRRGAPGAPVTAARDAELRIDAGAPFSTLGGRAAEPAALRRLA
jgi:peptidoglycan/LPS O-acetylase OafA/YrhL